jgi:hypothetical protein
MRPVSRKCSATSAPNAVTSLKWVVLWHRRAEHGSGNDLPAPLSLPAKKEAVIINKNTYPLHFPLHVLKGHLRKPRKLLKKMVGPWGLEPQTSTVSILKKGIAAMSTISDPSSNHAGFVASAAHSATAAYRGIFMLSGESTSQNTSQNRISLMNWRIFI